MLKSITLVSNETFLPDQVAEKKKRFKFVVDVIKLRAEVLSQIPLTHVKEKCTRSTQIPLTCEMFNISLAFQSFSINYFNTPCSTETKLN